jgi:hypothetical protein
MSKKVYIALLFTLVVATVALFATGEVLAQPSCSPLPGITITYDGYEQKADLSYEFKYILSGNKSNETTSIDYALGAKVNVVWMPPAYHYSEPGEGSSVSEMNWLEGLYLYRALTATPQDVGDEKVFYFRVSSPAEANGAAMINATRGRAELCLITVPAAYAQAAVEERKDFIAEDGVSICTNVNPTTQGIIVVHCDTRLPRTDGVPISEVFDIHGFPAKSFSVPGSPSGMFIADDGVPGATKYMCCEGVCYPY